MPFLRFQFQNGTFLELSASDSGTAIQEPKRRPQRTPRHPAPCVRITNATGGPVHFLDTLTHGLALPPVLVWPAPLPCSLAVPLSRPTCCSCCPRLLSRESIFGFSPRAPCLLPENSILSSHPLPTPSRRLHQLKFESLPVQSSVHVKSHRPAHGRPLCSILARLRGSHAPVLPAHPADHIPVSGILLHPRTRDDMTPQNGGPSATL